MPTAHIVIPPHEIVISGNKLVDAVPIGIRRNIELIVGRSELWSGFDGSLVPAASPVSCPKGSSGIPPHCLSAPERAW